MPWFAVDDQFAFHMKALAAGNEALGMWVRAGSWCQQQGGTGVVPPGIVAALGGDELAEKLVTSGLWARTGTGYRFHEWDDYQRLNSASKNRSAKRAEAGRMGGIRSGEARRLAAQKRAEAETPNPIATGNFGQNSAKQNAKQTPKQHPKQTPFCFEANTGLDLQQSKQTKQNTNPLPLSLTPTPTFDYVEAAAFDSRTAHEQDAAAFDDGTPIPPEPDDDRPRLTAVPAMIETGSTPKRIHVSDPARTLVRLSAPTGVPRDVLASLSEQVQRLMNEPGIDPGDIATGVHEWFTRTNAGPRLLPNLVADAARARTAPKRAPNSKLRELDALARKLDQENP